MAEEHGVLVIKYVNLNQALFLSLLLAPTSSSCRFRDRATLLSSFFPPTCACSHFLVSLACSTRGLSGRSGKYKGPRRNSQHNHTHGNVSP